MVLLRNNKGEVNDEKIISFNVNGSFGGGFSRL